MFRSCLHFLAFAWLALFSQAEGAIITFTDPGLFAASAGGTLAVESFESVPVTNSEFSLNSVLLPEFTLNSGVTFGAFDQTEYFGTYATEGTRYLVTHFTLSTWMMAFSFDRPLSAFGLDVTDFGDNGPSSLKLQVGSSIYDIANSPRANGNQLFFGIQGTGETFQTVNLLVQGDPIGIDNVRFLVVPEPAVSSLGLMGCAMLLMLRRRERG